MNKISSVSMFVSLFVSLFVVSACFGQTPELDRAKIQFVSPDAAASGAGKPSMEVQDLSDKDYAKGLNDPRLYPYINDDGMMDKGIIAKSKLPYTDRDWFTYWKYMIAAGLGWNPYTDECGVEYDLWQPLCGKLVKDQYIRTTIGDSGMVINVKGCTMYRETVQSPWIFDYTSLDLRTIQMIRQTLAPISGK